MIIYISGGVRSGKSRFAQEMALQLSGNPIYVATAKIWDDSFKQRVDMHRQDRGPEWTTLEAMQDVFSLPIENRIAVIDCVTLWITNLFITNHNDLNLTLNAFKHEVDELLKLDGTFIIISNELGMGLHGETELGRKFADLQGWCNQYVAGKALEAILMVSGLPLWLKKKGD